ncbi:MAG: NYN domain-containing protein [Fretibacterium sp.]|nr:NYN domain-containing protein [Fretibacterium sp.]
MSEKNTSNDVSGIALFIDVENFVGLCSRLAVPMALRPICEKLREFGPLRYRRAYGDIYKAVKSTGGTDSSVDFLRKELTRNMIAIEDVPYVVEHKNSADISIVTNAMSLAYENDHISHFAFVSQDRDYIPLYSKLRELGRKTIAISFDEANRSDMLISIVDHLFYYENLLNISTIPFIKGEALTEINLNEALALLVRACRKLLHDGKALNGASIANLMRQLQSDFDLERLGFDSFRSFLEHAEQKGVLKKVLVRTGRDLTVELPEQTSDGLPSVTTETKRDPHQIAEEYRNLIREVVKIDLPGPVVRDQVLKAAFRSLATGITLQEWGFRTEETLYQLDEQVFRHYKGLNQVVFKMLLSLYYARCLHAESWSFQSSVANIVVNGIDVSSYEELPYKLERQMSSTIRLRLREPLDPEALCLFLYDRLDTPFLERAQQIIDDISS